MNNTVGRGAHGGGGHALRHPSRHGGGHRHRRRHAGAAWGGIDAYAPRVVVDDSAFDDIDDADVLHALALLRRASPRLLDRILRMYGV